MLKNNNSNKRGLNEKKNIELHFFFLAGCCLHCVSVSLAANFCSPMFACLFFFFFSPGGCRLFEASVLFV